MVQALKMPSLSGNAVFVTQLKKKLMTTIDKTPNRAGMVCMNLAGQVLLVNPIGYHTQWVFPKGHLEPEETPDKTAIRECYEETGVVATALSRIGITSFTQIRGETEESVTIEWWSGFAVRKLLQQPEDEYTFIETDYRDSKWVSVEDAFKLLSFDDLKIILRKALAYE